MSASFVIYRALIHELFNSRYNCKFDFWLLLCVKKVVGWEGGDGSEFFLMYSYLNLVYLQQQLHLKFPFKGYEQEFFKTRLSGAAGAWRCWRLVSSLKSLIENVSHICTPNPNSVNVICKVQMQVGRLDICPMYCVCSSHIMSNILWQRDAVKKKTRHIQWHCH